VPLFLVMTTMLESVEFLVAKALDARCEPKMQKVGRPGEYFRVPVRVGRMDVTPDQL
jgi:hypothetical protein